MCAVGGGGDIAYSKIRHACAIVGMRYEPRMLLGPDFRAQPVSMVPLLYHNRQETGCGWMATGRKAKGACTGVYGTAGSAPRETISGAKFPLIV